MLMEKSLSENHYIINLSGINSTSQLVFELSSMMESPDVKGKNIYLKLGNIDLKQSQLLSIKALIESMNATISTIDTSSEQTEAAAISLGINVNKSEPGNISSDSIMADSESEQQPSQMNSSEELQNTDIEQNELNESNEESEFDNNKTIEVHAIDNTTTGSIESLEGIEDIYDEVSTEILSEVIPSESHSGADFGTIAAQEGLLPNEETSKYILLETGSILSESIEKNTINTEKLPTLYINQTLRSGQSVNYEGNILIIGDAHPGSEIIAGGDITVWGILGGIAHAGNNGNVTAKVRALKLNAIQLRISGLYARRNDTLNVPYVQKTNEFSPEEALIEDEKIVIYKKLRRD